MSSSTILFCLIVGISDGDTLTARCDDIQEQIKVRLAEIDAPEKNQAFGMKSKQSLSAICFQHRAELHVFNHDRYGRTVARVKCDDVDANAEQVRLGMAWVYDKYAKDHSLYRFQDKARATHQGLWTDPTPIPPWEFRKKARLGGKQKRN